MKSPQLDWQKKPSCFLDTWIPGVVEKHPAGKIEKDGFLGIAGPSVYSLNSLNADLVQCSGVVISQHPKHFLLRDPTLNRRVTVIHRITT